MCLLGKKLYVTKRAASARKSMLSFLALHSTAFLLAPPHIVKPPVPQRAAISAIFSIDNEKDIRNVAVVLASAMILASPTPAFAKGGGHGGGGGGGGGGHSSHSSHSSSSSSATRSLHSYSRYASPKPASVSSSSSLGQGRRGSSSSSRRGKRYSSSGSSYSPASSATTLAPSPSELPARLFPSEAMAREDGGGYYCPAEPPLPRAGEKLKVAGRKATVVSSTPQVALYGSQLQTIPGFDADCSVTVQYDDDGTAETLSAAEKAQPLWVKYLDLELVGGAYGGLGLLSALETSAWEKEEKRHDAMLRELKPSWNHPARPTPVRSCPKSGEYWGSSEESDEGDQSVRSTITFEASGAVRGRGVDCEDGPYTITKGVWGRREGDKEHEVSVGWIEMYHEGFTVVVEGFYNSETGKIEARFRSSRGVSGRFMLAPKPSIFS